MYGSENWILNVTTTALLESFLAEMAKRILKLPKWASNSVVNVMMGWPTMKARILVRKLGFLLRLVSELMDMRWVQGLSKVCQMTWNHYAWSGNAENLSISFRHTTLTKFLGGGGDQVNVRDIKMEVYKIDKQRALEKCGTADRSPAAVTIEERIGWIPRWEMALDCGERCVKKIQWLARALCHRCFGEDCTYPHVTITEDLLNSTDTNLQSVLFTYCSPFGVI